MLIRLTAAAMFAALIATSVPTASYAGSSKCENLLRDMQKTMDNRKRSGVMNRMEDLLEDIEDQCDVSTFLKAASKLGKYTKLLDKLKD